MKGLKRRQMWQVSCRDLGCGVAVVLWVSGCAKTHPGLADAGPVDSMAVADGIAADASGMDATALDVASADPVRT